MICINIYFNRKFEHITQTKRNIEITLKKRADQPLTGQGQPGQPSTVQGQSTEQGGQGQNGQPSTEVRNQDKDIEEDQDIEASIQNLFV